MEKDFPKHQRYDHSSIGSTSWDKQVSQCFISSLSVILIGFIPAGKFKSSSILFNLQSCLLGSENECDSPYNKCKNKIQVRNTREKKKSGMENLLDRRTVIFKNLLSMVSFCSLKISKSVEYALKRKRIKDLVIFSPIKY